MICLYLCPISVGGFSSVEIESHHHESINRVELPFIKLKTQWHFIDTSVQSQDWYNLRI